MTKVTVKSHPNHDSKFSRDINLQPPESGCAVVLIYYPALDTASTKEKGRLWWVHSAIIIASRKLRQEVMSLKSRELYKNLLPKPKPNKRSSEQKDGVRGF